ncbi:hypothetical protein [Actinoplanes rectilineatus]|uniref:hypothetical protein n=1 Tax=Actinoplanes rectilineatus TaxID=113571 RepID=UPI0005F2B994|nr:hypothetical protein [Actinoplanes rectilineatus]
MLDALAENPALPPDLLRRLAAGPGGGERVGLRADLPADVIEQIMTSGDLFPLARNRHLPEEVRLQLAVHDDPSVRESLAGAGNSGTVLARLARDPDPQVRTAVAQNRRTPDGSLTALARDPDPQVRATVAGYWTRAPEPVRRALLTDPADRVRAAACAIYFPRLPHPVPPADLLGALVEDPLTRAGAVAHLPLTDKLAQRLATDPDDDVRRMLASHTRLPAAVRDLLAADVNRRVRVAVFARPDTPAAMRSRIHDDVMRPGPARHDPFGGLDDNVVLRGIENHVAVGELRGLHLAWVTADPLPHVASPYVSFRASVARSMSLPEDAVRVLLEDAESIVRTAMARTMPHLVDPVTAERIDREFRPVKRTRWRPADDLPLPVSVLRRLADDPDPRMRRLAPRDPDLPVALAERLAADPDPSVRSTIAGHPRLPVRTLVRLLDDPEPSVAAAAARAPSLPRTAMERLITPAG